jgi:ankyrin repeat protein
LAKLLLRFNAKVNTKTGIYIDGIGDITPLHRAYWSAELTKLLLEKGADPNAKDTSGETPSDWARMSDDPAVARLYQSP